MSVVAWDGKTLAADKAEFNGSMKFEGFKLHVIAADTVIAHVGGAAQAVAMIQWWKSGAKPGDFPQENRDKDEWTRLIIASRDHDGSKTLITYENSPYPLRLWAPYMAWGAAAQVAMGALAAGASAERAVEIAIKHHDAAGFGVEAWTL